MELLPVLLSGPMKKTLDSRRFFLDVNDVIITLTKVFITHSCIYLYLGLPQDTANLGNVLKSRPVRSSPYVVKMGGAFNVIADGQPFIYTSNSTDAFLCLLSTYYVFNIVYCKQTLLSLLFAQSELLCKRDDTTQSCSVLRNLLLQMRHVNPDSADSE
jgi:hypothetical protein